MSTQPSSSAGSFSLSRPVFQDTSVDCAICLCPLSEQPCLTLTCGHIWHLACVRSQILQAQPNPAKRLLFSGCRCAKCAAFCDHPVLADVAGAHLNLSIKVDGLITEQIKVDGVQLRGKEALEYGRRTYAFYLCTLCEEPYFGGTIECADADNRDLPSNDRLCPACSPRSTSTCGDASHRAFYVWKCRYCCERASYVCYGSTHFCNSCHQRNSNRAAGEEMIPMECPGAGHCSTPLADGEEKHANGPAPECELLLHCGWCLSDVRHALPRSEHGSPNMLFNPSGQRRLAGWHALSLVMWQIEESEFPLRRCPVNFVSSYQWSVMAQVVKLPQFVREPSNAFVEVSARYMARWDCPSLFVLEAVLFDSDCNQLRHFKTEKLSAPADYWDRARHVFEPTEDAHYAMIVVHGKDQRTWAGNYGSKVADCCVRVLFDDSVGDESAVIVPNAFENVSEPDPESVLPVLQAYSNTHLSSQRMLNGHITRTQQQRLRQLQWLGTPRQFG